MAGIFTDKRDQKLRLSYEGVDRYGSKQSGTEDLPGRQVTTSFRTNGRHGEDPLDANRELEMYRKSNWLTYSKYDTGHEFDTLKTSIRTSHPRVSLAADKTRYVGPLCFNPYLFGSDPFVYPDNIDVNFYGTQAVNRTIPTHPASSISTLFGELMRDGIPTADIATIKPFRKTSGSKKKDVWDMISGLGQDQLNLSFAWVPFMNEVLGILKAVAKTPQILEQLSRDSGRQVRRSYKFETIKKDLPDRIEAWPPGGGYMFLNYHGWSPLTTDGNAPQVKSLTASTTSVRRIWFSGAYEYYLEHPEGAMEKAHYYARMADAILGLKLTPEVLWNLAPWSWLADWKYNFGDMISNATRFSQDDLVMKYGYLMVHDFIRVKIRGRESNLSAKMDPVTHLITERKRRFRATPYGFGSNPSSWTERQWAILAALGMTKGDKVAF